MKGSGLRSTSITIEHLPGRSQYSLEADYNPRFIEELSKRVSVTQRRWDPEGLRWLVDEDAWSPAVREAIIGCFDRAWARRQTSAGPCLVSMLDGTSFQPLTVRR